MISLPKSLSFCVRTFKNAAKITNTNLVPKETLQKELKPGQLGFTEDGGIKYIGFTYYPRFPGQEDPPYTPSKVHMVEKIRCLKKKPYWEKNIMKELGLDGKRSIIAIVPNTPDFNSKLWKVKHLVRITPITFPNGLPEDNPNCYQLKENGEVVYIPSLKSDIQTSEIEAMKPADEKRMGGETLAKHLRLKWIKPWD
nr:EOG090X0EYV [Cyclestheria hislopi]